MSPHQAHRRNRITLSCNFCKKRKVKCDRLKPCSSCIKYNVGDLCDYHYMNINGRSGIVLDRSNGYENMYQSDPRGEKEIVISTDEAGQDNTKARFNKRVKGIPDGSLGHMPEPNMRIGTSSGVFMAGFSQYPNNGQTPLYSNMSNSYAMPIGVQASPNVDQISPSAFPGRQLTNGAIYRPYNLSQNPNELNTALEITKLKEQISRLESAVSETRQIQHGEPDNPGFKIHSNLGSESYSRISTSGPSSSFEKNSNKALPQSPMDSDRSSVQLAPIIITDTYSGRNDVRYSPEVLKYSSNFNPQFVGVNPFDSDNDIINFYEGYTSICTHNPSRRMNHGPFSWLSSMKKDSAFAIICDYVAGELKSKIFQPSKKHNQEDGDDLFACKKSMDKSEIGFRKRVIENGGFREIKSYDSMKDSQTSDAMYNSTDFPPMKMSDHAINLGISTFNNKLEQELSLIKIIEQVLPNQRITWLLVDRFFSFLYPFMPCLDEDDFTAEIVRLIGPRDYKEEPIPKLNIEKRLDFAYIGTLLLLLRLSYFSLISNRQDINDRNKKPEGSTGSENDLKYLLENPIDMKVTRMARLCLEQFDLVKRTNLTVFQFVLFMLLYRIYSFDDGEGDWQISTAILTQMAQSIGLNRDPSTYGQASISEKHNNLLRKLWLIVKGFDITQSMSLGMPLNLNSKFSDTRMPSFMNGNENIKDTDMEKNVIDSYNFFKDYCFKTSHILDLTLEIQGQLKMKVLTGLVSELEVLLSTSCDNLTTFMTPFSQDKYHYPFLKVLKCERYMLMKSFLITLYQHFYTHYEKTKKHEISNFYVKKIFAISFGEIVPCFVQIISNNEVIFGEVTDTMINPRTQTLLQKVNQIIFVFLVRVNTTIHRMKSDERHSEKTLYDIAYKVQFHELCKLSKSLESLGEYCLSTLSKLSGKYYFAWRLSKAQNFFSKIVKREKTYEKISENEDIALFNLSTDYLYELNTICENSLSDVRKFCKTLHEPEKTLEQSEEKGDTECHSQNNTETPSRSFSHKNPSRDEHEFPVFNSEEVDRNWIQMFSTKTKENNELVPGRYNQGMTNSEQDFISGFDSDWDLPNANSPNTAVLSDEMFDIFATIPTEQLTGIQATNLSSRL